jgi:hypothetical protein
MWNWNQKNKKVQLKKPLLLEKLKTWVVPNTPFLKQKRCKQKLLLEKLKTWVVPNTPFLKQKRCKQKG